MAEKNKKQKKYYEAWGDTLNALHLFRTLCIVLVFAVIGLVLLLKQAVVKPPLVVKVSELGQPTIVTNYQSEVSVSPPEVLNFVQTFIDLFTGHNYYTYDENFRKSFKMMTLECQKKMDEYLTTNKIIDQIKQAQYKTKVNISVVDITKDSKEAVFVKLKGYREVLSYLNPEFKKEIFFETDLVLKKVNRQIQTPWGLLVDHYKETIFKEQ